MNTYRIVIKGETYYVNATSAQEAETILRRSRFSDDILPDDNATVTESSIPTGDTSNLNIINQTNSPALYIDTRSIGSGAGGIGDVGVSSGEVLPSSPLNLTKEQLERERQPFGQFQRGFLTGLGRDPDAQLGGAERRFFQTRQAPGLSSILFDALLNPTTFQDFIGVAGVADLDETDKNFINSQRQLQGLAPITDAETQRASQFRLSEAAKNLGARGVDVFQNARNTFRNLLAGANQNFSGLDNNSAQRTSLLELTNPSFNNRQALTDLYNLGLGAAQDRYGTFLGSRIIPNQANLEAQFQTASAPEREAGFLDFLGNRLGLT